MTRIQSPISVDGVLEELLSRFCPRHSDCTIVPIGHGNINDTYLVKTSAKKFILQRISATVFPKPLHVITNFQKIAAHLERRIGAIAPEWQFARSVLTDQGNLFFRDERGDFWRGQTYLHHKVVTVLNSRQQGYELGRTLGIFHLLVSDMDGETLHDPLPGFHILPQYLEKFDCTREKNSSMEAGSQYCQESIEKHRNKAAILERAKEDGILTKQPIHGDPKIDNFIFNKLGCGVGLIDMDTVSLGLLHYDLGDCLRSCCNRSGEGGGVNREIQFDMEICKAILEGYFLQAGSLFSPSARSYIYDAVLLLTFELGLRFFTDHLVGNRYFKIDFSGENLQRAVIQFRLVEEIEKYESEIRAAAEI
ncbi:MAG: hypothetical protein BA862_09090 [Desulfobulbaceae bacterium S3730MH12]|nr:MAG: hypothetical protein BA862_09090 [Desulfobulbaceae bacterium S3730MH12]